MLHLQQDALKLNLAERDMGIIKRSSFRKLVRRITGEQECDSANLIVYIRG